MSEKSLSSKLYATYFYKKEDVRSAVLKLKGVIRHNNGYIKRRDLVEIFGEELTK